MEENAPVDAGVLSLPGPESGVGCREVVLERLGADGTAVEVGDVAKAGLE